MTLILTLLLSINALAATKKDSWYKVEPPETRKEHSTTPQYQFDSIENNAKVETYQLAPIWNLGSKFSLGIGFLYDDDYHKKRHHKPFFIAGDFTFSDKAWSRWRTGGALSFRSEFLLTTSFDWTPSRQSNRWIYSLGMALRVDPSSEFRNLLVARNYYIIPSIGMEFLVAPARGLRLELKGLLGTEDMGALLQWTYLWESV